MRIFLIPFVFLPLLTTGQTFSGKQTINSCNYDFEIKINSDSSFIVTKSFIESGKKKKKIDDYHPFPGDSFAYYTGKAKKINDTTTFLHLDDTYALSFFPTDYEAKGHIYLACLNSKADSMLISYDSIRFKIAPKFRLIYQDNFDTIYKLNTLDEPCRNYKNNGQPTYEWTDRQISSSFAFSINPKHLTNSKFVYFDIGLKYPCNGQPIIFKVPADKYPEFKNWNAQSFSLLLINTDKACYLILYADGDYDFHNSMLNYTGPRMELKKNCN